MGTAPSTILICDSDADLLALLHQHLGAAGYTTLTALSPTEADDWLATARVDLVLAEPFQRPGARWDELERLRERAGPAPVVLMTCRPLCEFADYKARGFADYLAKPFGEERLLATIGRSIPAASGTPPDGSGRLARLVARLRRRGASPQP